MNEVIQWPDGDFTIQQAVDLNATIAPAAVRKKLADALAAKKIIQTKKGNEKVKGTFQLMKAVA